MAMATRRTWLWILVGAFGLGLVVLVVLAGAGVYFVMQHISTERSTGVDAIRAFDAVRAAFPGSKPLYELDSDEHPTMTRPFSEMPTSAVKPQHLRVLAWDPDDERLVKIALPFWILRLQQAKMAVGAEEHGFDLERLELDGQELERIGPALVFDFRARDGTRVLLWTQ
jgi:hypothetical protein